MIKNKKSIIDISIVLGVVIQIVLILLKHYEILTINWGWVLSPLILAISFIIANIIMFVIATNRL